MTVQEAAQVSLNTRWEPMVQVKSIKKMLDILYSSRCTLCDMFHSCMVGCPLNFNGKACGDYTNWEEACDNNDLPAALTAAEAVCKRLRWIVKGDYS